LTCRIVSEIFSAKHNAVVDGNRMNSSVSGEPCNVQTPDWYHRHRLIVAGCMGWEWGGKEE